jgi:hypothetical protein
VLVDDLDPAGTASACQANLAEGFSFTLGPGSFQLGHAALNAAWVKLLRWLRRLNHLNMSPLTTWA